MICSPTENLEWYCATVGGLGLTGLITWAELQLRPIVSRMIRQRSLKFRGVEEFLAVSRASEKSEYTVSWIDCVAQRRNFARGIFMIGDHEQTPGNLHKSKEPRLSIPVNLPAFVLNRTSVRAFNTLYYYRQMSRERTELIDKPLKTRHLV